MELHEMIEYVDGPDSFLEFVDMLIADRLRESGRPIDRWGRGTNGWENHTIEAFLEAATRWAGDSRFGVNQGLQGASAWKMCATFLYCGKIYE